MPSGIGRVKPASTPAMEVSFYRDRELAREPHSLPAATYNMTRTLLAQCDQDCLFVPIRSMQYLAIIDAEEIIFVPQTHRNEIELAWQHFNPHDRASLDDPVPYEAVFYLEQGKETIKRLHMEFYQALKILADRRQFSGPAKVLKLKRPT